MSPTSAGRKTRFFILVGNEGDAGTRGVSVQRIDPPRPPPETIGHALARPVARPLRMPGPPARRGERWQHGPDVAGWRGTRRSLADGRLGDAAQQHSRVHFRNDGLIDGLTRNPTAKNTKTLS